MSPSGEQNELSSSAARVQQVLDAQGISLKVVELPNSTRTAVEAAHAVGCEVGQIAKSLVFISRQSHRPVLVIASGSNRVDEGKVGRLVGEKLRMASADEVRELTGFAIGGVPPVGHLQPLETWIDADLLEYKLIWAAAGNPRAVFALTPDELVRITGGSVAETA
jgi:prolyl-tRNA editing enzyme YbaK/EbsC (Cys-tRNA(Pro) deacylase)